MRANAFAPSLKQLCAGLKAAFKGETLVGFGILSSSNKPAKIGRTTRINISSRADYKTKLSKDKGFPSELQEFTVNGLGMKAIDARLFKLNFLVKLDMTRNAVSQLSKGLFRLKLKVLILSNNALSESSFPPKVNDSALAHSLEKLDLGENKFRQIPSSITRFRRLHTLILDKNEIFRLRTNLPPSLKVLSARNNKLEFGEFCRFRKFEKLELEGNPFSMKKSHLIQLPARPAVSSLLQFAAQQYLDNGFVYNSKMLPWNICEMLDSARYCPCCKPIWQRRHMFLAEFDVRDYCSLPSAPRATDFTIPQLEFCCSKSCFNKFVDKFEITEAPEPEQMQIEPAE